MAAATSLLRLVSLLIALPAFLTYIHLHYNRSRYGICFVGPAEADTVILSPASASVETKSIETKQDATKPTTDLDLSTLFGMYMLRSPVGEDKGTFFFVHGSNRKWKLGWPSVASVASVLATPTSRLLRRQGGRSEDIFGYVLVYNGNNSWCIQRVDGRHIFDGLSICSRDYGDPDDDDDLIHLYPPSGTWTVTTVARPNGPAASSYYGRQIRVSCPGPSTTKDSRKGGDLAGTSASGSILGSVRRNPNKHRSSKPNKNIQQILHRPATTLLLCLNIYLAYRYWSTHTSPSSLAKIYSKLVVEYELWRSFSGATAHFEPLHLGFNMMALYSLGMELEEGYGSIPFLFYNISLIVLTTAVMMGLTWLRIRHTGNAALAETSTVGYSGVLFAWMVVTSLERSNTCPIPFMQELCFDTYSFFGGRLKFNVGPLVQLVVAQFIMPRVSFVGHLAGIICGFFLHWNLLPLELFCPQVLIPACFLAHLRFVRKIIPIQSGDSTDGLLQEEGNSIGTGSNQRRPERMHRRHRFLVLVKNAMVVVEVISIGIFQTSIFLSQVVSVLFFAFAVQSNAELLRQREQSSRSIEDKRKMAMGISRGGILWRGTVISLVLLIVTDAMALSAWLVASVNISSERFLLVGLWPELALLFCRFLINIIGLCLAVGVLHDLVEVGGGIFAVLFGPALRWGREVADRLFSAHASSSTDAAFEVRGIALGDANPLHTS